MPNDHKPPQLTKNEQNLLAVKRHFDNRFIEVASQINAICIVLKIDPKEFIEAFHNREAQAKFFQESIKIAQELESKMEADAKQIEENTKDFINDLQTKGPKERDKILAEMIEGKGDKII